MVGSSIALAESGMNPLPPPIPIDNKCHAKTHYNLPRHLIATLLATTSSPSTARILHRLTIHYLHQASHAELPQTTHGRSFRIFRLWGAGLLAPGLGFGQEGSGIVHDVMLRFGSPKGEHNSSRRRKPTESGGAGILATQKGSNSHPQGNVQPLQG